MLLKAVRIEAIPVEGVVRGDGGMGVGTQPTLSEAHFLRLGGLQAALRLRLQLAWS